MSTNVPDDDVETAIMTMELDAADPASLVAVLAKYAVVSRGQNGCRNIDLSASTTHAGRFVVISKWASPDAARQHLDSPAAVEMARACEGLLVRAPRIDLLEGLSAHDLA
ncbi:MAG: antibiotic biosynthesis monooxygenase [Acidimicrobiia bacterium]|nr:antibiotic biosynthesis monooxygenase [Acidimicrobiia bacterium]